MASFTFQKPENALKRAEELIDVDKKQDALETLNAAIQHRKFKNQWTMTLENIMIKHLELCVELKRMKTAREGLYQYRGTCQAANISSLEKVVKRFREAAEAKVSEAKQLAEGKIQGVNDLDEMEAPETILLQSIQAHDTRQQSQDRDVHMHFRFLWDTYKVILDILKTNIRLEDPYHETARHAFEFCRVNKRPQEFKRLCDTLRKNYGELFKKPGTNTPQHQVKPDNPETITRTLDTRCKQLQIATELDLWRESYVTATEIFELMSKGRAKPQQRSMYFEYLGQIFWKSENHLFHAFACLKNLLFVKANKKQNLRMEELQLLASKAVLATLCVPFQRNNDMHTTLELNSEGASSSYEKAKKHATLFNAQSVPTRETIIGQLVEKNLLTFAAEPCERLFALIESDFTPLSLCQDAKPYLDAIAEDDSICEGKLKDYVTPLKQIIFFRLMKQLSEVYANITIENFERAASIVPFSVAEKWMANAARQQGINIQINYSQRAIVFAAPRKVDMKSMRQPLIEIGYKLQQAMQRVAPEEQHKKERKEKQDLMRSYQRRLENETQRIRQRKEEIERRKEESEKRKELLEKEAQERIRKQEAREAEAERVRQEEERRRRDADREEQKRKDAELLKQQAMLEQMKKSAEVGGNLKVGGKKITDITTDDLEKIGLDQIEKTREAQVQRERQEKIRQRKLESKRVDHLARALREEERARLEDWTVEVGKQDEEYLQEANKRHQAEQKVQWEKDQKEKEVFVVFQAAKDEWVDSKMASRDEEYRAKAEAREARLLKQVVENKLERARIKQANYWKEKEEEEADKRRREEEMEQKRLDDERRAEEQRLAEERRQAEQERLEEEQARKAEQAETRRQQRLEEDAKRERQDAMRREKEREIEEKMNGPRDRDDRDAPRGAWGRDRDDGRSAPRGGRRGDDDDRDWRRDAPRDPPRGDDRDWRRDAPRDPPRGDDRDGRRDAPRDPPRGDDRDGRRDAPRDPPRAEEEEEEEDDAGWSTATKSKKGKKDRGGGGDEGPPQRGGGRGEDEGGPWRRGQGGGGGGGGEGGDGRKPPPWRSSAGGGQSGGLRDGEGGAEDDRSGRMRQSRETWKSHGQDGGGDREGGAGPSAPWRRGSGAGGGAGGGSGGADGGRWR